MSKDKARSSKPTPTARDGSKYRNEPSATADTIARKPGTRIYQTKEDKPQKHDGDGADDHAADGHASGDHDSRRDE